MKNIKSTQLILALCTSLLFIHSCAYRRIGDLTVVSTRNIDSKTDYKLIQKYVFGKAKSKHDDVLQQAIDNAVKKVPEGEYLTNVRIYIKPSGKKVKVEGDVWGIPKVDKNIILAAKDTIHYSVGSKVTFKNSKGKLSTGKIVGVNKSVAIVEYEAMFGKLKKIEVKYEELTVVN